jgi:DNA helicase HerA-like ATPase
MKTELPFVRAGREMLRYVGDNAKNYTTQYGNITKQSIGAIQRSLLVLEEQGAEHFFAEPAVNIIDFIRTDAGGRGNINILASDQLHHFPALYTTFLLWLLSELFEKLPEVGDLEKPRLVFFFDEAHLLFNGTPKVLIQKIEQVIRLIRSKGVGVYFIIQNPKDIPETVLGQLGNKVQHALRAFTPRDQAAVKAVANTFRPNPNLNVEQIITQLTVGEALISFLDEEGRPNMVERAHVIPPRSHPGSISLEKRREIMASSPLAGRYEDMFDRESAYEKLQSSSKQSYDYEIKGRGTTSSKPSSKKRTTDTPMDRMAKSAMSSIGREIGRELARGFLGTLFKK